MKDHQRTFNRVQTDAPDKTVTIKVDGRSMEVPAGITVAAAILNNDADHFCTCAANQDKRSPHCLMGVCFECLCEIDGLPNRQACLEQVADGMQVKRQQKVGQQS
jgi:predicted molibdopterin-dependent oxidoreductase YjgC